jgi:hypothetical protein
MPFFKWRLLGSVTRQEVEKFIDSISERKLSAARKDTLLKAGAIPLSNLKERLSRFRFSAMDFWSPTITTWVRIQGKDADWTRCGA